MFFIFNFYFFIVEVWIICLPREVVVIHKKKKKKKITDKRISVKEESLMDDDQAQLAIVYITLLWAELCPSKFRCCSSNSQSLRMTLLWDRVFTEIIKFKWGHWNETLFNTASVLTKRWNFWTLTATQTCQVNMKVAIYKPTKNSFLPHSPEEGTTLISRLLSLHNCETTHFWCWGHGLWHFVMAVRY